MRLSRNRGLHFRILGIVHDKDQSKYLGLRKRFLLVGELAVSFTNLNCWKRVMTYTVL